MDIQYLLFLQNFRNSINDALTPFMEMLSLFAVTSLVIIPAIIYWCVDKESGLYTLASFTTTIAINAVVKLTACVYRPWIRDSRVLPAGDAISTATGYSFPSGHTTSATSTYGAMAVSAWKKMRWVSILCVIFALLTCFSRNYLGVHTPQDVAVGITEGVLVIWGMRKLFNYLRENPEKENLFLALGVVFSFAALFYISVKSYPMDYVDGKLLVDPQKMMNDGYGDLGKMMGFIIARYIEKHWIRFEPRKFDVLCIVVSIVGLVGMVLLKSYLSPLMNEWLGSHWGKLVFSIIYTGYYIALFPLVLKLIGKRKPQTA
jgi:membrane-associated phospholipid phosphatase